MARKAAAKAQKATPDAPATPKKTPAKKRTPKKAGPKHPPKKAARHTAIEQIVEAATANSHAAVLDRLHAVVLDRRDADPLQSHSARLMSRGVAKVAQKFGEEAVECLIEAVAGNPDALVAESADVLYHLVVMWVAAGIAPDQVWTELTRREGISGVAEKAARVKPPGGTTKIP